MRSPFGRGIRRDRAGVSPFAPHRTTDPRKAGRTECRFHIGRRTVRPRPLRIAQWANGLAGNEVHPDCKEAVLRAAKACAEIGHVVEEAAPQADFPTLLESWKTTYFAAAQLDIEAASSLLFGKSLTRDDVEPLTWATAERGRSLTALDYQVAAFMRQQEARRIAAFHATYDVWITPTLASPPVRTGTFSGALTTVDDWQPILEYMSFCCVANATGQPAISLPLHWNADGLPIGSMFTAECGKEAVLLQLAAQLEEARPWRGRRPPIWG